MNKGLLLSVMLIAVIVISGCAYFGAKDTLPIIKEKENVKEKTEIKTSCGDDNICTKDIFNELTGKCEYETILNCCGNNKCEDGERCEAGAIQTACINDCGRLCSSYLIVHATEDAETTEENTYICGSEEGCTKIGDNKFKITKSGAKVTTKISNVGETSSDIITSSLLCKTDVTSVRDGEEMEGIMFKDYFTDDDTKNTFNNVNPIQSTSDNFVFYNLKFTATTIPNTDVTCDITLNSDEFENKQSVQLMFVGS
ncbi:MAG: hypothetical protein AABW84_00115 [Nanoarchaeota archaeon]